MALARTTRLLFAPKHRRLFFTRSKASMARDAEQASIEAQKLLDDLYAEVKAQRFEDVVVIETKFNADPRYYIVGSAFNSRHLVNGTEMLNRNYKLNIRTDAQDFARLSVSEGWNVLDYHSVVVHLLSKKSREHYDIEQLWAVGEKYDSHVQMLQGKNESRDVN